MVADIPFTFNEFCISIARVAICTCYKKKFKMRKRHVKKDPLGPCSPGPWSSSIPCEIVCMTHDKVQYKSYLRTKQIGPLIC